YRPPMSRRSFLEQSARSRTTEAIKQIESVTAAEVVVTVHKAAAKYRRTSVSLGGAFAVLVALVMLLSPRVYRCLVIVLDVALAWLVGFALCEAVPRLKHALTRDGALATEVEQAARRAFDELKVGGTKDKTGLLVYVALFERRVQVLPDSGIAVEVLGPD